MDASTFAHRAETFGFDTTRPWAEEALRLLFNAPRVYEPLAKAWDSQYPGTMAALWRLERAGWIEHQRGVVMNVRTGEAARHSTRPVSRFRTTARGRRLLEAFDEDDRVLSDLFPAAAGHNLDGVVRLLEHYDLDGSHARYGLSAIEGTSVSGMPERTTRWWVRRLTDEKLLRELPEKFADTREVIPAHFRVTRRLCKQLRDVLDAYEAAAHLKVEFRLGRSRFLSDIDPARLGISGATDFDHDIEAQRILAALFCSPLCEPDGKVVVEPRYFLPLDRTRQPPTFDVDSKEVLYYQPDAEIRERHDNTLHRSIIEYERYQTRRDAWNHLERFLGYLHTTTFPFEAAILRFVVDTPQRVRSYVQLIEAFADHLLDHPELAPANPVRLAVASTERVLRADDPLAWRHWHWLPIGGSADTDVAVPSVHAPVLHERDDSPYDDYFGRL